MNGHFHFDPNLMCQCHLYNKLETSQATSASSRQFRKPKLSIKWSSRLTFLSHFTMRTQSAIIYFLLFITFAMSTCQAAHLYTNAGLLLKLFGIYPYSNNVVVVDREGKCITVSTYSILANFRLRSENMISN